jgi:hypothetical protein
MPEEPRIDTLPGLCALIDQDNMIVNRPARLSPEVMPAGVLFCPGCGDVRRASVRCLDAFIGGTDRKPAFPGTLSYGTINKVLDTADQLCPSWFEYRCTQCSTVFIAIVYKGPDGPSLVVLPDKRGGLATPHSPPMVAYYLDQAHRSRCMEAYTAAVAMYRGALDSLLFEQGFTGRMLGPKIAALEQAITAGKAPAWTAHLESDFLKAIKDLGNASMHPDNADVTAHLELDADLCSQMDGLFQMLLWVVYEEPHKRASALSTLQAKKRAFDRKPNT